MDGIGVNGCLEFNLRLKIDFNDIHNQPICTKLQIFTYYSSRERTLGQLRNFQFENLQFLTCEILINMKLR